jgi:hypothetical protein
VAEITDTEEVTGSNPVSPTKKVLVSHPFCDLARACALGSVDLSAYRLASPSKSSLMARAPRVMTGRSSFRAGSEPADQVNPAAVQAMAEVDIDSNASVCASTGEAEPSIWCADFT